ncbi:protein argonaute-2-like isoform X2 [Aethina tumida]|nr:protein argonaute-2-like isoform X2 [Aethina tumida]
MQLKSPEKKQIIPGKLGRKIQLESNHLTLKIGGLLEAYHYDVAIKPDMPKKVLPTVFEMFRRQHFPDRHPAFDGRKNMYTPKKMPWPSKSGTIVVPVDEVNKTFEVEIKFANAVDLSPLHDLKSQTFSPMAALAVIDIVLRSAASKNCCAVGRSFFTKPAGQILDLGNGLEMYQGFYQSAIRGGKLLLNVDVAHKGFPKEQPVMDAIVEVCGSRYQQVDLTRELRRDQYVILEKYLRTLRVVYQIPGQPSTKRVYGVNGLSDPACRNSFKHNGVSMTIQNYFKTERRYILKYPNMPTLWVGSKQRKERIMVPAECCTILANQAVNRKMNENQTSAMIKYAATNTRVRKEKIMTGVKLANYDSDPVVKEFGFSVGSNFEQLEGRVLDSPRLAYNDNKEVQVAKGVWRADNMKFFIPVAIQKWTIAWADRYQPRGLENLERQIKTIGQKNGMHIGDAIKPFEFAGTSLNELTNYFEKKKDFNIIFVIVPNQGPIYSDVKKAAELKVGCLTQCIKAKTVDKLNPQTVANILLKVNSKLTGVNHCLGTVSRPPILSRPCMIMGADVTHPSPDAQNTPSVAAVVASHDPKAFRYNICWRLQNPKEEVIIDLKNIAKEQLLYFYNQNKCQKPHTIVFFRDGVSEGQFDTIRNVEIRAIQNACRELQADYEPKITFVVVQKRHHTRLFPKNDRDSDDRNINVPAGTCVDNTITNPCMQDFYLVSHASIQGVAKPTKYCTLWDDNNFSNDDLEQLAYFLCHMFTRCNRSVSYPAPTYYAHLAAARTKVYIENNKSLNMNNLGDEQTKHTIKTSIRKDKPMFFV